MLTSDQAHDLFSRVLRYSQADETELLIAGGRSALSRFANNAITQNVAEENYILSLRVVFGGRTARATTNKFDEASIERLVKAASGLAKVQHPDADLLPLADKAAFSPNGHPIKRAFGESASITPEERAHAIEQMVKIAGRHKLTAAGIFSCSESIEAVLNSRQLAAFHTQTSSEISVTMLGKDSSGWNKANSPNVRDLDATHLAEIAAEKAMQSAGPRELPAGKYTVILEPAAVLDLVGFMFWDWGGQAVLDERSFLNNRIAQQVFGENIQIADDVYHPLQTGASFDGEGVRRQRVQLVEHGIVRRLVYARGTAEKMRKSPWAAKVGPIEATGHGFPLPNAMGEAPLNIVFTAPGETRRVEQMIAGTERGILVTRMWYIREVDPYEKILTGMTRDGTFLVEDGKIRGGLRNFRFNQSLIEMLRNVEQMSEPVRASGEESFDMVVPAMKVRDFNFTEVTKF
ncbi:MAG TPA: TldD/PmbA family protein [Terriglobales bacterium]|nr:TldD/PmbA family protein [Terriglobales bacterium]